MWQGVHGYERVSTSVDASVASRATWHATVDVAAHIRARGLACVRAPRAATRHLSGCSPNRNPPAAA
eukprot:6094152-Pleurochrysis_carterae.AAC.3